MVFIPWVSVLFSIPRLLMSALIVSAGLPEQLSEQEETSGARAGRERPVAESEVRT